MTLPELHYISMNVMNEFFVKDFWWWNLGKMSPHRSVRISAQRDDRVGKRV